MHKKILIINAHPKKDSFNFALANNYRLGAESSGAEVQVLNIVDIEFNRFKIAFDNEQTDEAIKKVQQLIHWADHTVWVFPLWWYNMPALMKALIEQTFLSGFGFRYYKSGTTAKMEKLLHGKTAHIISTMDAPPWYYIYWLGDPVGKTLKASFSYCGMKLKKRTYLGIVKSSSDNQREKWLQKVKKLGKQLK